MPSLGFFNWIDKNVNWIFDAFLELLTLPITILFRLISTLSYYQKEALFKAFGYGDYQCRLKAACQIVDKVSNVMPKSLKHYLQNNVGFVLSLASANSEYFDAAFTGYMHFNCTAFYNDPAC